MFKTLSDLQRELTLQQNCYKSHVATLPCKKQNYRKLYQT